MSIEADVRKYHDFFIGEDKVLQFAVQNAVGVAVDITGWTLEWTMRQTYNSTVILIKNIGTGVTITDGAAGICEVVIPDTDTDNLTARRYEHALWRIDPGNEQKLAHGQIDLRDH